tara:strand:- start:362 stop:1360 length:999 start_codon:yes stop_codon:yes gene_type:complete
LQPSIDFIYVNYFSINETLNSISTLLNTEIYNIINLNIIVFDNSYIYEKDSLRLKLENLKINKYNNCFEMKYLPSEKNVGFGAGCNIAAKSCNSDNIIFINCDTDFSLTKKEGVLKLVEKINSDVTICGPKIISNERLLHASCFSFDPTSIIFKPFRHVRKMGRLTKFIPEYKFFKKRIDRITYEGMDKNSSCYVDWVSGCFMVVSRVFFEKVNGFDERYFLYFEDVDLCRKARKYGHRVLFDPSLSLIHKARYQSSSTYGILSSLIKNKTSRYHLSSWIKYIFKWRYDFFSKLFYIFTKFIYKKNLRSSFFFKKSKLLKHYCNNFVNNSNN